MKRFINALLGTFAFTLLLVLIGFHAMLQLVPRRRA